MFKKGGLLGDILEQGGTLAKQTVKQVATTPVSLVKTAAKQAGVSPTQKEPSTSDQQQTKAQTEEVVKHLYGAKDASQNNHASIAEGAQGESKDSKRTPEEIQKIEQLRKQLHGQYYQSIINPPKQQEERPVEKVEREQQEQQMELIEKEKKKPQPIAVQRAKNTTESFRGVSG